MLQLDGRNMTTREAAHDEIMAKLALPAYYGRNLDALWDCACGMEAEVELINAAEMKAALGEYAEALIDTLREAAEENEGFVFQWSE